MNIKLLASKMGAEIIVATALEEAANKFGVVMVDHWLAQIIVESGGFKVTRENLRYRAERLLAVFPSRVRDLAHAQQLVDGGESAIAEAMYGGRMGNVNAGDGARFIGRGFKQLTGRENYTNYSLAMYGDKRCVEHPVLLELVPDAALSAGWFWKHRRIDTCGDDIVAVTKLVNGGQNGLAERRAALARIRKLI